MNKGDNIYKNEVKQIIRLFKRTLTNDVKIINIVLKPEFKVWINKIQKYKHYDNDYSVANSKLYPTDTGIPLKFRNDKTIPLRTDRPKM